MSKKIKRIFAIEEESMDIVGGYIAEAIPPTTEGTPLEQIIRATFEIPSSESRVVLFMSLADYNSIYKREGGDKHLIDAWIKDEEKKNELGYVFNQEPTINKQARIKLYSKNRFNIARVIATAATMEDAEVAVVLNVPNSIAANLTKNPPSKGSLIKQASTEIAKAKAKAARALKAQSADEIEDEALVVGTPEAALLKKIIKHENFIVTFRINALKKVKDEFSDKTNFEDIVAHFNVEKIVLGYYNPDVRRSAIEEYHKEHGVGKAETELAKSKEAEAKASEEEKNKLSDWEIKTFNDAVVRLADAIEDAVKDGIPPEIKRVITDAAKFAIKLAETEGGSKPENEGKFPKNQRRNVLAAAVKEAQIEDRDEILAKFGLGPATGKSRATVSSSETKTDEPAPEEVEIKSVGIAAKTFNIKYQTSIDASIRSEVNEFYEKAKTKSNDTYIDQYVSHLLKLIRDDREAAKQK